jgi:DNA-binding beta-propeller fold protein YncE
MVLFESLSGIPGHHAARQAENWLCLSTFSQRVVKGSLLLAAVLGLLTTAFLHCAYADLYVISENSNSVLRYDEVTGAFLGEFISPGSGGLQDPRGLLFARDGNLYVTSSNNNSVMRYDGTTGAPLPAPGQTGATFVAKGSGGLISPAQLVLGHDGNLYVDSQSNNAVLRYDGTTGEFIDAFVPHGSGGLDSPRGLVFGPDGNLYIKCPGVVMRFDGSTGAPLPAPGKTGAIFASSGLMGHDGPPLVFGPDGNLYVGDYERSSILRFSGATGELIDTFVSPGSGGLDGPGPLMLFGPDNNLYICSEGNNKVLRFDGTSGAFVDVFIGAGAGGLLFPHGLCFTTTDPTTHSYGRGPANHFLLTASRTAIAGTLFDITLTAVDLYGNVDANYQGTVTFSTSDPDSGVVLPADYTFATGDGGDNGVHTFPTGAMLVTLGDQTFTGTDTVSGITGSITITVGPGP